MDSLLARLRSVWRGQIESGGSHCPVCDRWGKIYGRNINKTMAQSLIWLCHAEGDAEGWVDVPAKAPRWVVQSNQLPTLKWWGLVERRGNDGKNKTKFSGMWRPTAKGLDFVHHGARIEKQVFTYNDEVQGYGTATVTLRDCFEDNFDYQSTMNTYLPAHLRKGVTP